MIISIVVLILGFIFYGKFCEKNFGPDDRDTPAIVKQDGVDFVPLKQFKSFIIQFLNIAGSGPIFGALMGAVFGPIVYLWIVLGCILGGAVQDYFIGMISCRNEGKSLTELVSKYLSKHIKYILVVFICALLLLVGSVFAISPSLLLSELTNNFLSNTFWIIVIFVYYIISTIFPIDKIIGKIYPIFGFILIFMAVTIFIGVIARNNGTMSELSFKNMHPEGLPVFPFMFLTVTCGAISGFHSTQSPMISKCIKKDKEGRRIFYGSMVTESIVTLIWVSAGIAFYGSCEILNDNLHLLGQSAVVYDIAKGLLGNVGGVIAIIGVIVCPISTGDTAFRSLRLILSESFHLSQKKLSNRLIICIPMFIIAFIISRLDYEILWRYLSLSNQTLAMISFCTITSYLAKEGKRRMSYLITFFPALFMTFICISYLICAKETLNYSPLISYVIAGSVVVIIASLYLIKVIRSRRRKEIA